MVAINLDEVVGADLGAVETTWGPDDGIRYDLGLGASVRTSPAELHCFCKKDLAHAVVTC